MTKQEQINNFDPNGVGVKNGHFIGLPFTKETAEVVLLPVPWDVTVSYGNGTASGPENILECSSQLDLFDLDVADAWKIGLYMCPPDENWMHINKQYRRMSEVLIEEMEHGETIENSPHLKDLQTSINRISLELKQWVKAETTKLLRSGKKVGIVGGEHSVPLGYLEALSEVHEEFGILQIDAHMDLRAAYEGFTYSHASIFYNALKLPQITKLVQVGIRDFCQEEYDLVQNSNRRVEVFYDNQLRQAQFEGEQFHHQVEAIISRLPQKVYISFDIDGLDPKLCPATGTPVPGGLEFNEAMYIIKKIKESGREIIGFDLCEVGGIEHEWDGNVGARILYKLANALGS